MSGGWSCISTETVEKRKLVEFCWKPLRIREIMFFEDFFFDFKKLLKYDFGPISLVQIKERTRGTLRR